MPSSIRVADPVAGYLDALLNDSVVHSQTDWNQVLDEVVSARKTEPVVERKPVTTLRAGMAPICLNQPGEGHAGIQLLDSLVLLNRLPANTRLHSHILSVCKMLLNRVTHVR